MNLLEDHITTDLPSKKKWFVKVSRYGKTLLLKEYSKKFKRNIKEVKE